MAIGPLKRAVERNPSGATAKYHLGLAYAKSGDPVRARQQLTEALKLQKNAAWSGEADKVLAGLAAAR
jgi:Flp pilus assembly protein TadD